MASTWIVVNTPKNWDFEVPGVEVLSAKDYLTRAEHGEARHVRVYNLCRSYRYMSLGYYVSLLAEARGHRPMPSVSTLQDMRSSATAREVSSDLLELVQRSLRPIRGSKFTLSVYFGRNLAKRYDRLSNALFNLFPVPLLRVQFQRRGKQWQLTSVGPIPSREVPDGHRSFVAEAAADYFQRRISRPRARRAYRYDLALLHDPDEVASPSNPRALKKFERAAERVGLRTTFLQRNDLGRLGEFDALFLRETTYVNHHTYRFAARAAAAGMVVIDDPESIIRCTNKVYLAELLSRHRIPIPRTQVLHRENLEDELGTGRFPRILKRPDSSFSQGVEKVDDAEAMRAEAERMFVDSDLIIAQEFVPTEFDWRIGVLAGQPLFACRYYMAKRHWQIIDWAGGRAREGNADTLPLDEVPPTVLRTALRAAKLVGRGLYGVDLKQIGRRVVVMEINDNPSIDAGVEDLHLGDELYERVMQHFLDELDRRHGREVPR